MSARKSAGGTLLDVVMTFIEDMILVIIFIIVVIILVIVFYYCFLFYFDVFCFWK